MPDLLIIMVKLKNNKIRTIILIFSILLSVSVVGQKDSGTTTVITFDDSKTFDDYRTSNNFARNVIKFDPYAILIGDYSVYYERTLNSKWALEIGLGITGQDFLRGLSGIFEEDGNSELQSSSNTTYSTGSTYKLGAKFYPGAFAPEDFFIQAQYAFREYKETYNFDDLYDFEYLPTNNMDGSRINNELRLCVGTSSFLGNSDHWMSEYFIGTGVKFMQIDEVMSRPTGLYNSVGQEIQEIYMQTNEVTKFAFYLGWKLGYAF